MDQILSGLKGVACYLDDVILTATSKSQHLKLLENVLARIRAVWGPPQENQVRFSAGGGRVFGSRGRFERHTPHRGKDTGTHRDRK